MSTPKMKTARRTGSGFTSPLLPTPTQVANIHRISRCGILPPNSSSLRGTVSLAKTELARYDAEIVKLQTELDRLASERATLLSYSTSCQSVLSARHRLPNELLAFIFELSFPHFRYRLYDYATGTVERLRLSHHHILQLGRISSRWHKIAMETPKLWSTVTVDTSTWDSYNSPQMLKLLESSLRRSQDHALDLHVKIGTRHDLGYHNESLFQLLAKTAYRWRHARIVWHGKPPNSIPRILGNLEKLETLELDLGWRMIDTVEAPCLRHFSFHGNMDNLPSLPWHQLRSCRYRGKGLPTSLSPLSLLPTANESTAFTFAFNLALVSDDDEIVVSSNIRSVEFSLNTGDKPGAVEKLLDCLTFPCLQAFKYRPMPPDAYLPVPNWPSTHFLTLADRSSFATHLIYLTIHAKITEDELLLNVKALNCLEELCVMDSFTDPLDRHVVVTDKLLQGLLYYNIPGKASLVPKLRVLTFETAMEFTDSVYFDLVASRIEKVHVVDGGGAFSANIRRCKGSRKLGFSTQHKFKSFVSNRTLLFQYVEMKFEGEGN
ncbi:hypothetical protein R3P38DRAFT_2883776 [Favolaschia claudopus]|uniref:F-box domain-containing protein n=1 Tax=Favolaschia claudopus TaxID=2862362 RepID=A0AAW0CYH4_9AGAR